MKKFLLAPLFSLCAFSASAEWSGGVGYLKLSDDVGSTDVSVSAIVGELKYKFHGNEDFSWIAGARYGIGLQDDTVRFYGGKIDIELDRFMAIDLRGQFQLNETVYAFVMPTYANAKITASYLRESESDSDWEFGGAAGIGYQFNDQASIEASYQKYDSTDGLGVTLTFKF